MFIAEIRAKNGSRLFQGMPNEDRIEAARYAFRNGPANAKTCSTSGAYRDPSGNWRSNGMDIRWHKRRPQSGRSAWRMRIKRRWRAITSRWRRFC